MERGELRTLSKKLNKLLQAAGLEAGYHYRLDFLNMRLAVEGVEAAKRVGRLLRRAYDGSDGSTFWWSLSRLAR
jgi:hypothetical protein